MKTLKTEVSCRQLNRKVSVTFDSTGLTHEQMHNLLMHSSSPTVRIQARWDKLSVAQLEKLFAPGAPPYIVHLSEFLTTATAEDTLRAILSGCDSEEAALARLREYNLIK